MHGAVELAPKVWPPARPAAGVDCAALRRPGSAALAVNQALGRSLDVIRNATDLDKFSHETKGNAGKHLSSAALALVFTLNHKVPVKRIAEDRVLDTALDKKFGEAAVVCRRRTPYRTWYRSTERRPR